MGEYYGVRRTDDDDRLEHIGLPKGWKKPNAKYIARLVTDYGYRYLYTPAQVAAAQAGKAVGKAANQVGRAAGQAGRAIDRTVGFSARRKARATARVAEGLTRPSKKGDYRDQPNPRYGRIARDKAKKARSRYDQTLLGRAENAINSGRRAASRAASDAANQVSRAARKARRGAQDAWDTVSGSVNNAYKTARSQAIKTGKAVSRAATNTYNAARKGVNDAGNYVNKQVNKGKKAIKDYQRFRNLSDAERSIAVAADKAGMKKIKNPLNGKSYSVHGASTASKIYNMEQAIRNAPGNAARSLSDAGRKARRGAQDAWDTVSGSVNNAYKTARSQAIKTGKAVSRAADNVIGGSAKKNLKRQQDRYNKAMASDAYLDMPYNDERRRKTAQRDARVKNAERAYSKAQDRYDRTLMGRAERVAENARENTGRAVGAAGKAVGAARKAISDAVNRPSRTEKKSSALETRVSRKRAAWDRADRKEKLQQERLASIRGNRRVEGAWSNRADIKNGINDQFNKDRPVTAKSHKAWKENTRRKLSGNTKALNEHIPPRTSRRRATRKRR